VSLRRWRAGPAWAAATALLLAQGCASGPDSGAAQSLAAPAIAPTAGRSAAERVAAEGMIELPITLYKGYPLIAGEVNGKQGRFMLDTGSPFGFFLNSRFAPVTVGPEVGRGHAGSGQPIVVHQGRDVTSLTLGAGASREVQPAEPGKAPAKSPGIMTADFGFLQEGLVPDFLGFIGAPWLSSFVFSLRYEPAQWLLTRTGADAQRLLEGSERVALVRFEGKEGPLPYATFQVDGVDLRVRFDTGTPGGLQLTAELKARLEQTGALQCPKDGKPAPNLQCVLGGLRYGPAELTLDAIATSTGPDNRMTLGTALLGRYVSVWNLSESTLDLRRDVPR